MRVSCGEKSGFAGNHEFFVRGDHQAQESRSRGDASICTFSMIFVKVLIEFWMQDSKVSQYPRPDRRAVFPDAACEYQRIDRRERSRQTEDRTGQSITEHLNRQASPFVPFICCRDDQTHIPTDSGNAEETASSGQDFLRNILERALFLLLQIKMETRVDVTAAGAHHQSFQRRKSHGGINASAIADRRCAAPISKMRRNKLSLVEGLINQFRCLKSDKMMARTVESIPTDPILFVVFIGNRVVKGVVRESLMERGIEHRDLRLIGEQFGSDANEINARRIMKGCEICKFFDPSHDAFGDENGLAKLFSAMNHPMSDRSDVESTPVPQDVDHAQERGTMIRSGHYLLVLNSIEINQFQVSRVCFQSLRDPRCQRRFSLRIKK